MGMADDMRNLAQEIANSFQARVARVEALRQETAAMLKRFQQEMKNARQDLGRFLSNAEASRKGDFRALHRGIRARQEERSREVAGMLDGCRREREAAASHWQKLATTMARMRASATR